MGWAIILVLVAVIFLVAWQNAKKRKAMLDAMSPDERQKFLDDEEAQLAALREREDEKRSEGAKQQISIAKAEGRKYARVWVPQNDVESVMRWAERQTFTALRVKEGKQTADIQLSISGF